MQQLMNMTRDPACHIAVPNAVRQHHPRNIIAAREQCREIPACIAAAGHRNHVALQPRQLQRTVRPLIPRPKLHAPKWTQGRSRARQFRRLNLLEFHGSTNLAQPFMECGEWPPRSNLAVLFFPQGWKGPSKNRFPKQVRRYGSLASNPVYWNRAMDLRPASVLRWLFDPERGARDRLLPRWLFLRALGVIYFSAFFSLLFQIRGLIGPNGILPAVEYLRAVNSIGFARFWYAPTLFWFSAGNHALMAVCWTGLLASALLTINILPRGTLLVCFVCFISFVSAASDFSGYQSDGMLLEAGFISLFLAPPGFRPRLAANSPPMRAGIFLLLWEWFRIYFESGIAKIASGDPQWRHFTAMDEYYQNGPLPTWIGWYAEHLPQWFHAASAFGTLALELVLVWMLFFPRRVRIICFFIVTPWQIGIILTANYTFLNYLVLALGIFLLDDRFLA